MTSRTMNCFTKVAIKGLSLLFLFHFFTCLTTCGQAEDLAHIFNALPKVAGGLTGYKITALETNVTFDAGKSAREILRSNIKTNFNKAQIAWLEKCSRLGADTNICSYVYRFENGVVFISREQFDTLGKLIQKETTLATSNEVREYYNPVEAIDGHDGNTGQAEIRILKTNSMFGIPQFLSKSTLRDCIENSSVQNCETSKSLAGQDCYIITISGTPDTPVQKYKLFLRSDTFSPLGFESYLTNGTIYSHSDLQFEEPGNSPFICKRADTQYFNDGKLDWQSVWIVEQIEEDKTLLAENVESFIPPKTQVLDQRFSKPLNYHMGAHPPTPAQINLMLTDSNGVASYESGLYIQAGTNPISSEKQNWIRGIFIAFIISPLLIFLPRLLKKR